MTKYSSDMTMSEVLGLNLIIPEYQRPYEWKKKNVYILIEDIKKSYDENKNKDFNLGTIILKKNNAKFEIVDGQQRLITLTMLLKVLGSIINLKLLDYEIFCSQTTEMNISKNYKALVQFIKLLKEKDNFNCKDFCKYLEEKVYFYVIKASSYKESFQLFDGRNSKYKDLSPIDLLKAYHLGRLSADLSKNDKMIIYQTWNNNMEKRYGNISRNEHIFSDVLFNIYNWSLNKYTREFTKDDIYLYKGYDKNSEYNYVKYYDSINKGLSDNNKYQINKPFKAGEDFFYMVNYYIKKYDEIITDKNLLSTFGLNDKNEDSMRFIYLLYYNALLLFDDKFGSDIDDFYKYTINDFILKWSGILRIKKAMLGLRQINYYILKPNNNFFFECNNAINIDELYKLELENFSEKDIKGSNLMEMRGLICKKMKE